MFFFPIFFTQLSPEKFVRYPDDHMYSMYEDPWEFMEQIFIKEPKSELKSTKIRTVRLMCLLISSAPNVFWFFKKVLPEIKTVYSNLQDDGYKALYSDSTRNLALKFFLPTIATLFIAKIFDKIAKSHFKQNILFEKFKNMIVTSPNNKDRLPEAHQKMIEHLYEIYTKNASEKELRNESTKIIPKIKQAIYEHFEKKYQHKIKKRKKIPSWLKWCIVSVAIAGTIKLLVSAAKDGFDLSEKIENLRAPRGDDGGGGGGGHDGGGSSGGGGGLGGGYHVDFEEEKKREEDKKREETSDELDNLIEKNFSPE